MAGAVRARVQGSLGDHKSAGRAVEWSRVATLAPLGISSINLRGPSPLFHHLSPTDAPGHIFIGSLVAPAPLQSGGEDRGGSRQI